ncbi:hypothetical protein FPOA_11924 [Fusarium poae]|jgi:hypothetical protein|uniref:Uncharacterized protein n=1 Tax=Fusarium poae TaxID=36050 RepID=A0A1B8A8M8_FUSPO|nr:hypothetical protein FPOA_12598 [Fusarium poae]OBS17630.1 hypothetical protein FPOA_11924 [Fusarium poae]
MKKHRVRKNTSDDKIVEKCNKLTKQSCSPPVWHEFDDEQIPNDNYVALVVDVDQSSGSVWFSERLTKTYLDMVGQDNKGMVIVCFDEEVEVVCFGACRVGKIFGVQNSTS